jgi:hypothetical protein
MILYFCVFLKGFTPFLNCPSFKNYLKFLKWISAYHNRVLRLLGKILP